MDIANLFNYLEINRFGDGKINIYKYLTEKFNDFYDKLENISAPKPLMKLIKSESNNIKRLGACILETIDIYYSGSPSKAYIKFSEIMNLTYEKLKIFHIQQDIEVANQKLYRIRIDKSDSIKSKEEMFHIPFDKRCLIKNQRYSISGFPCLYLGSSLYNCWIEVNNNNINILKASRFRITKKPNIFDLSIEYKMITDTEDSLDMNGYYYDWIRETIIVKLFLYQLILACSIRSNSKASFNEAYIIPQLLLEWIRNNAEIDGLKYISTHYTDKSKPRKEFINYVFPPKKVKEKGCCDFLLNIFINSEPIKIILEKNIDLYTYLKEKEKSEIDPMECATIK